MTAVLQTETMPPDLRMRGLIAAIASISVVGMNIGLGLPLLSFTLDRLHYSSSQIGANTIAGGAAALLVLPFIGQLTKQFGAAQLLFISLMISALVFPLFYVTDNLWAWLVLRFFYHGSIAVAFSLSEFWISSVADEKRRGFFLGVYGAMLAVGFSLGPALLNQLGSEGPLPFVVGASIMVAASLPVLFAWKASPPTHSDDHGNVIRFLKQFPEASLSALAFGIIETGAMTMVAVYGLALGYDQGLSALLLMALSAGNVAAQVPLGWLSDKVDRRKLMLGAACIGAVMMLLLPLAHGQVVPVFALIALAASVLPALYMCGLSEIAANLRGAEQANGNASFVMMYTAGGLIGPTAFGLGMEYLKPDGFPLVGAFVLGLYAIFIAYRLFSRDNS